MDDDRVELANVHRQAMYDELDAASAVPKVQAAATRIKEINGDVMVEPVQCAWARTTSPTWPPRWT